MSHRRWETVEARSMLRRQPRGKKVVQHRRMGRVVQGYHATVTLRFSSVITAAFTCAYNLSGLPQRLLQQWSLHRERKREKERERATESERVKVASHQHV